MNSPVKEVVVFGNQRSASLARYCLTEDSPYKVIAHTVDKLYCDDAYFDGLPLIPFEELNIELPPTSVFLINPMGYQKINSVRKERYEQAKIKGYGFINYISSRASIWPDLNVGDNTLIYEHATIQPFARIGDNVIIRSGAHISHHCRIESHTFISAEVTLGGGVTVGEQAFLGLGAIIRNDVKIAPRCFIGAGAVVTKDTEEGCSYIGNPLRKLDKPAIELW